MADRSARNNRRQANYRYYIDVLGMTAKEARRLRDVAPTTGQTYVAREIGRIRREPEPQRTETERRKLERYSEVEQALPQARDTRTGETPARQRARRLANFRMWSNKDVGFPSRLRARITAINIDAKRDPNASYGYRVFYHTYVNDKLPVEAQLQAERRDT